MIAALFVDEIGIYSNLNFVDVWGITKDARNYNGPYSVVAHPPCQLWGKFAKINYMRWGGEHNKPGNDGGCFYFSLKTIRQFGGVLEHPAYSYAFDEYSLKKPKKVGWNKVNDLEYVCEVWQSAYGHLARKKTWLYYCGVNTPHELNWEKKTGLYHIGFHDQRGKDKNKRTISGKKASATPELFRDELIKLAKNTGWDNSALNEKEGNK